MTRCKVASDRDRSDYVKVGFFGDINGTLVLSAAAWSAMRSSLEESGYRLEVTDEIATVMYGMATLQDGRWGLYHGPYPSPEPLLDVEPVSPTDAILELPGEKLVYVIREGRWTKV